MNKGVQRGLSLLELALALAVASLLSWASWAAYETVVQQQERERAQAHGQQLQSLLRAFALRQGRLPCPDASAQGQGLESAAACASGAPLGWLPYVSLGLELPQPALRARYAVLRAAHAAPGQDADLAVARERSGDPASASTFQHASDLIIALHNAGALAFSASRPYLSGDSGSAIDCATAPFTPVAYWIVIPLQDQDGDGQRLDAPHTASAPASLCAASPSAGLRRFSDDLVVAESPAQLAGWLRQNLP